MIQNRFYKKKDGFGVYNIGIKMRSYREKFFFYLKVFGELLEKWRWLFLIILSIFVIWLELHEFLSSKSDSFHFVETFIYLIFIAFIGVLFEVAVRSNQVYKRMGKILEHKHNLSLELSLYNDWDSLTSVLVELPGKIAKEVDETYLLVSDSSGKLEVTEHWVKDEELLKNRIWDPTIPCSICLQKIPDRKINFHLCLDDNESPSYYAYSLGIMSQYFPTTVLKFKLRPGARLSDSEEDLFNNIGDEIAVALQASRDRKRLAEMQSAQVAMAERRTVSTFVHDQLGQNLGYIHLKLDQLSVDENIKKMKEIRTELSRLRDVANESYEIVRDILKKIQPETIPHLTNLLQEHARTVSRRAKFELDFKSIGKPVYVDPNIQQLIFFTFREILSNVEKHANACKVEALVIWNDGILDISVSDNGRGFDPRLVQSDEHFGLIIMQERLANIKGRFMVNSSKDSGTTVSISVPLEVGKIGLL